MIKIGLDIVSAGYGGVSGGGLSIWVIRNNFYKKFSGFCQGLSSSKMHVYDMQLSNDLPDGADPSILLDLNLFDVKLEIPTPFGLCNPVEINLQLFEKGSMQPVFRTARRASAWGFSLGSITALMDAGQMKLVGKGNWAEYQESVGRQMQEEIQRDMRVAAMY